MEVAVFLNNVLHSFLVLRFLVFYNSKIVLKLRFVRQKAKIKLGSNTGVVNVHKDGLQVHYIHSVYPREQRPILFAYCTPSTSPFCVPSVVLYSFCILLFFSSL
jgi:hypothetical protein